MLKVVSCIENVGVKSLLVKKQQLGIVKVFCTPL